MYGSHIIMRINRLNVIIIKLVFKNIRKQSISEYNTVVTYWVHTYMYSNTYIYIYVRKLCTHQEWMLVYRKKNCIQASIIFSLFSFLHFAFFAFLYLLLYSHCIYRIYTKYILYMHYIYSLQNKITSCRNPKALSST